MSNERWSINRNRYLNPPRRLTRLRPHVPSTPSADFPSQLLPSVSAGTYHQVNESLKRANRLIGTDIHTARQNRESALNALLQDINTRIPSLRTFTANISYNPETFQGVRATSRGTTGGWSDQRSNQPYSWLNDPAFNNVNTVNRTVRHEIWHLIQRTRPNVYRGNWNNQLGNWDGVNLRRFDAHLRDLERRRAFALTSAEKFLSLRQADRHFRQLRQGDRHWQNGLTQQQRSNFQSRFNDLLPRVCHELRNTQFRTHPDYSRICGPQPGSLQWMWQQGNIPRTFQPQRGFQTMPGRPGPFR